MNLQVSDIEARMLRAMIPGAIRAVDVEKVGKIKKGSLYTLLQRMEEKGHVETRGTQRTKFYSVTWRGVRALEAYDHYNG